MKCKEQIILLLIIILALGLRLWNLGENPPSLYWDEASLGYNAYSILKTGKDEHGEFLPIARFIAFGDYKPPGYIYATVPSIAIFGLTEFAVRFPSALAGTLTVLITFLLVKELFRNSKTMKQFNNETIAATAALLLAISPWHLQFSRGAFEANLATFFSATGVFLFLKGLKKSWYLPASSVFFVLAMYTFNSHRVFVPLLIPVLIFIYRNKLQDKIKFVLFSLITAAVIAAPLLPFVLSREGQLRFQEVTIFRNLDPISTANQRIAREGGSLWARLVHNRRLQFALEFFKHFSDHLKPDFLFFSGDVNPRLGTRDQGVLYLIEFPLLLIGFYYLAKAREKRIGALLAIWWMLGIIPAATARETPHALRTMNILPVPQIIIGIAVVGLYRNLKKKKLLSALLVTGYLALAVSYLHTYHKHYPRQWAASWQYGYKQMVSKVEALQSEYDRVFVTTKYGRPYIYFLFFRQYDPRLYWQEREAQRDWFGLWTVSGFGKYSFGEIPSDAPGNAEKWLLVTGPKGMPENAGMIERIKLPNEEVVFEIGSL